MVGKPTAVKTSGVTDPTLRMERAMLRDGARLVIGCDEVGRGAIAGPVAVGLSVFAGRAGGAPKGLRDSKMLSEPRREELYPVVAQWSVSSAVGMASNEEVERIGIIAALGLAAVRALAELHDLGVEMAGAVVLLDGSHDWLTPAIERGGAIPAGAPRPAVTMRVKADRDCAVVAAASVLAKVRRDRLMIEADPVHPGYHWTGNKGYASADHYAAIDELGPSPLHRWSWLRQQTLDIAG